MLAQPHHHPLSISQGREPPCNFECFWAKGSSSKVETTLIYYCLTLFSTAESTESEESEESDDSVEFTESKESEKSEDSAESAESEESVESAEST